MQHSFDIEIAKKYGVNSAILLNNLYYWTEKNRANAKHFYDGVYWTYNSRKAFAELFPYMNPRQIEYAMQKLIDDGVVITGNYNENAYDRTLWYGITKKGYSILQNCEMENTKFGNGIAEIEKPIPNIKQTAKTTNKNYIDVLDYLNDKAGTRFRSVESNIKYINARMKDGYTVDDLKAVIDKKVKEWKGTDFQRFLRPETLFNATKFETYLNGLEAVEKPNKNADGYMKHEYGEKLNNSFKTWEDLLQERGNG